ncbi:flavodoxin family protein [Pyxidicoccus sp. 3LFB2]
MKRKKLMLSIVFGAVVLALAAFALMVAKDRTYVPSAPYAPSGESNREVAVVYYSRSGHTEAVAREIARTFNAPIARIDADYPRDFGGQSKAVADANAQALPEIRVEPLDLAPARRIFLVSPTWMFRPATPLWAYVEQTDLTGKEVVLVMTGNSRFKQEGVDEFAERVQARGGRLTRHIFLRRGRIYWQKSREELLREVRAEIGAAR